MINSRAPLWLASLGRCKRETMRRAEKMTRFAASCPWKVLYKAPQLPRWSAQLTHFCLASLPCLSGRRICAKNVRVKCRTRRKADGGGIVPQSPTRDPPGVRQLAVGGRAHRLQLGCARVAAADVRSAIYVAPLGEGGRAAAARGFADRRCSAFIGPRPPPRGLARRRIWRGLLNRCTATSSRGNAFASFG